MQPNREDSIDNEHREPTPRAVRRLRVAVTAVTLTVFLAVLPGLAAAGVVEPHNLNRLGRFLAFAIAALGIDLVWGYTGILSLCQAFFFCLGGYGMAMFLSLPEGGGDVRPEYNHIPQFFFFNNVDTLPAFWKPFASPAFALGCALLVPAIAASLFGFFIFRSRVRGVYFSIMTQAVAWGAFLAFSRNEMLLGGTNGLTNFYKPMSQQLNWIIGLYLLTAGVLVGAYLLVRWVTKSRLGRILVAVRDNESRLLFAGYRPEMFKIFAFGFAALLAALGGMLYAPQNGIVTPNIMRVPDSIWMVIWVALGGRGRLWGAVLGTLVVKYSESILTSSMPETWPFVQAGMFLAVVMLFPDGFVGLWDRVEELVGEGAGWGRACFAATPLAAVVVFLSMEGLDFTPPFLARPVDLAGFLSRLLPPLNILLRLYVPSLPLNYWMLLTVLAACGGRRPLRRLREWRRGKRTDPDVLAAKEARA